jgi:hypothetical protein
MQRRRGGRACAGHGRCYPIDGSRTLVIEVDGQQFGLLWLEEQSQ